MNVLEGNRLQVDSGGPLRTEICLEQQVSTKAKRNYGCMFFFSSQLKGPRRMRGRELTH